MQNYEDAVTQLLFNPEWQTYVTTGKIYTNKITPAIRPFDELVISFFSEFSRRIFQYPDLRSSPDLAALGFWCRRANLLEMSKSWDFSKNVYGVGLVLHIPPSNVPLNFVYSLAIGLLSGNANILRLPSDLSNEGQLAVAEIALILTDPEFKSLNEYICFVNFDRDEKFLRYLSLTSDARIIWGGDQAVNYIKSLPSKPRTVDIAFANRTSMALLNCTAVSGASDDVIAVLARNFYSDAFTFNQNACSSPKLIVWLGNDDIEGAKVRFWGAVKNIVDERYELEPIHSMDRFVEICLAASGTVQIASIENPLSPFTRIILEDDTQWNKLSQLRFGVFIEASIKKIEEIHNLTNSKVQTIGYFGFAKEFMLELFATGQGCIPDRVVPIGQALNFTSIWDGYDLIRSLTRTQIIL